MKRREFIKASALFAAASSCPLTAAPQTAAREVITTDVLVIGAGTAGIPAALAAARAGKKVVLAEEHFSVGGAPVDMYVTMLCGWPRIGIFRQIVDRLQNRYHLLGRPVSPEEERRDIWFLPSSFQCVLSEMIRQEPNITLMCGARAKAPLCTEKNGQTTVNGAIIESACRGELAVEAAITIDASGSGLFSEMSGCRIMYGRESKTDFNESLGRDKADETVMPCTWMCISQKFSPKADAFDFSKMYGANESGYGWVKLQIEEARKRNTGIYLNWGTTVLCRDTRDPLALGEAQGNALEKLREQMDLLFENGYGMHLAPSIGIRECRRVRGLEVITENTLKQGSINDQTIALGQYYLDLWGRRLTEDEKNLPPFGIPYGALVPAGVSGLLVCGKIISGTHIAMSSYRVQPIAAQTGQAAGLAAAVCIDQKCMPAEIDVRKLRQHLQATGIEVERG